MYNIKERCIHDACMYITNTANHFSCNLCHFNIRFPTLFHVNKSMPDSPQHLGTCNRWLPKELTLIDHTCFIDMDKIRAHRYHIFFLNIMFFQDVGDYNSRFIFCIIYELLDFLQKFPIAFSSFKLNSINFPRMAASQD